MKSNKKKKMKAGCMNFSFDNVRRNDGMSYTIKYYQNSYNILKFKISPNSYAIFLNVSYLVPAVNKFLKYLKEFIRKKYFHITQFYFTSHIES